MSRPRDMRRDEGFALMLREERAEYHEAEAERRERAGLFVEPRGDTPPVDLLDLDVRDLLCHEAVQTMRERVRTIDHVSAGDLAPGTRCEHCIALEWVQSYENHYGRFGR